MEQITNTETLSFMKGWKILIAKLPKYELFKKLFNITINKTVGAMLLRTPDDVIDPVIKQSFLTVYNKITPNNALEIKYNQSYGLGRFYGNNSLVPLSRKIKHTLFNVMGWLDIDIKKAYPTFAVEIGRLNGEKFPFIEKYINSFDEIAETLIEFYSVEGETPLTKDHIKTCFCMMLFGGGFQSWIENVKKGNTKKGYVPLNMKNITEKDSFGNLIPHQLIVEFKGDANRLIEIIYTANSTLINKLTKKDEVLKLYEKKNRVVSYFFQIIENHLIYLLYGMLVNKRIISPNVCELEYDGLCIPPVPFEFDKLAVQAEIDEFIFKKTSLKINFVFKQHDANFIQYEVINDYNNNPIALGEETQFAEIIGEDFVETDGVYDDLGAANKLFELYPYFKYCDKNLFAFDDETGMWNCNNAIINKIITKFSVYLYLLKTKTDKDGNEIVIRSNKSYGSNAGMMKDMLVYLKTKCVDDNWVISSRNTGIGKILFLNGIYDCKTGVFIEKFNPDIVFFARIEHNYKPYSYADKEYMDDIKQRLFYATTNQEVGDYLILNLARGLAGDACSILKRFLFGIGLTNSGKGVLTEAITNSCGGYVSSFNAENLLYKKFGNNDTAQGLRWAMLLCMCRIIISNELDTKGEINGNDMKKLASGGDPLKGRFHSGNETTFYTHFLPFIFANDMVKIIPYDEAVDDRARFIQFERSFVENPQNELELKRDNNIKFEIKTDEFKRCFLGLLLITYKNFIDGGCVEIEPEEVKNAKNIYIGDEKGNVISRFLNDYEITGNANDFVKGHDIENWLKHNNLGISMTKFGIDMNRHLKINKITNVVNKNKKIGGKCFKCWIGIKEYKEFEIDDNNNDIEDEITENVKNENEILGKIDIEKLDTINQNKPVIVKCISKKTITVGGVELNIPKNI